MVSRIFRVGSGVASRHKAARVILTAGVFGVFGLSLVLGAMSRPALAAAGINKQISFQGKVVNSNGTNVTNGSYTFVFKLYSVSSGGSAIWTESKSLTVTDGIFQTNLGDTTSLPGSVDFNTNNIYLGINFNSDGEMSPRIQFTASPYAFNSDALQGLHASDFAQLNPSSAQTGSLNVTGTVQAATSLQAPVLDTATAVALAIGGTNATSVTVGKTTTPFTIQGNSSSTFTATSGSFTTTVGFTAPTANRSVSFPDAGGTVCTTVATTCSSVYGGAGTFLTKDGADTSTAAITASNYLYGFTNSSSAVASGVLKLDNGSNTGNALLVTASGNPGASRALIVANNTAGSPSGNLLDLQKAGTGVFTVDYNGNLTQSGGTSTTDTINGQTISSAANFTGTVTAATSVLSPLLDTPSSGGTLSIGTTNATGGIHLDQDTTVAAGKTLNVSNATGSNIVANAKVTGDTNSRLTVAANGQLAWGPGNAATDITLSRTGSTAMQGSGIWTFTGGLAAGSPSSQYGKLAVQISTAANAGIVVRGTTSQTGDLLQAQETGGATLASIGATGALTLGRSAASGVNQTGSAAFVYGGNTSGFVDTLTVGALTGSHTINLPDAGGTVCTDAASTCGGTTGAYVALQGSTPGTAQTGNINVSGTIIAGTGFNVGASAGSGTLTNNGSTKNATSALGDLAAGALGTAAATVDVYTSFSINPSASGRTYTIPAPSDGAAGRLIFISNISGSNTFTIGSTLFNTHSTGTLVYDGAGWNFAGMDGGSNNYIQNQTTADQSAGFRVTGTGRANTGFVAPAFDSISGGVGTLTFGNANATTINIGTNAVGHTIAIGTDATTVQGLTLGSTFTGSTTAIQGPTVTVGSAGASILKNNGATFNATCDYTSVTGATTLNTASKTPDVCTVFRITTIGAASITVPNPTAGAGSLVYVANLPASSNAFTLLGVSINPGVTTTLVYNGTAWTFAGADAGSLQTAYNNSGTADPQIQLSNTNGGLKIRDAASSTIGNLLQIADSTGASVYLGVTSAAVQVGGNLLFTKEAAHTIQISDSTISNAAGGALTVKSGAGNGTGAGGDLSLAAGASGGGATGNGGAVTIKGGNAVSTNGSGGNVTISGGTKTGTGTVGGVIIKAQTGADNSTMMLVQNASGDTFMRGNSVTPNSTLGLTNSSFETGLSPWVAKAGCTSFSQDFTTFRFGVVSAKCVTNTTARAGIRIPITLADNTQYTFSFYAVSTTNGSMSYGYASDGATETGGVIPNGTTASIGSDWRYAQYVFTFTTPASHSGTPYLWIGQGDATARSINFDAVQIEQSAVVTPFRNGNLEVDGTIDSSVVLFDQSGAGFGGNLQFVQSNGTVTAVIDANSGKAAFGTGGAYNTLTVGAPATVDSTANAFIMGPGGTSKNVVLQAASGQTGDLLQYQNNNGPSTGILGGITSAGNLYFGTTANHTISMTTQSAVNTAGVNLTVSSATGNGSGVGGDLVLNAGTGGATGAGGGASLTGGTGGGGNTAGGTATVSGGTASGTGTGGAVTVQGGAASATAGSASGAATLKTQNGTNGSGATAGGAAGTVSITGGNGGAGTGTNSTGAAGANISITAGNGGNATGTGTNGSGGNITLTAGSVGTGGTGGTAGAINLQGSFVNVGTAGSTLLTNNSATLNTALALGDLAAGNMGSSAAATVNVYSAFTINPSTAGRTYTPFSPTNGTGAGRIIYVSNISATNSFSITAGSTGVINPGVTATLVWNGSSWSFAGADAGNLQTAYNNQAGSTTPSIVATSTKAGVTIQSANTSGIAAGSEIFAVHSAVSGDILTGTNSYLAVTSYGIGVNLVSGTAATSGLDLQFGSVAAGSTRTIQVQSQTTANTAGGNLTVQAATGNGSGAGGNLVLNGGTGGGTGAGGNVTVSGGTATNTATGGAVTIQGGAAAAVAGSAGGGVAIQGANGTGTGTGGVGANVTITAGNAGGTGANAGGSITLTAGTATSTGVPGVVSIDSPVFASSSTQSISANTTLAASLVDNNATIPITSTGAGGWVVTVPSPTNTTVGRTINFTATSGSLAFSLAATGMTSVSMSSNYTATLMWNGTNWTTTAAGTSLQQVYDNTSTSPASIVTTSLTKTILFKNGTGFDGTTTFQIQLANGHRIFNINSQYVRVQVGDFSGFAGELSANLASDSPTGTSLAVANTFEIVNTNPGTTISKLLFTNTSGTGDFKMGSGSGDLFWQGGGGRALQNGAWWPLVLTGDIAGAAPNYPITNGSTYGGTGSYGGAGRSVLVLGGGGIGSGGTLASGTAIDAKVALTVVGNSNTQSGDLLQVARCLSSLNGVGTYAPITCTSPNSSNVMVVSATGATTHQPNTDSASAFQILRQGGNSLLVADTTTTPAGNGKLTVGSATSDANQTLLQLDSFSTFADTASCTNNQGAMYYNTNASSAAIRACVANSSGTTAWDDLVSTTGMGLLLFGVVPDSGTTGGDLVGVAGTIANGGPCKVYAGSAANTIRWTGCTVYSNGRKQIIAAQATNQAVTATANAFQHLCITTAGSAPTLSTANTTETSNLPNFSATAPVLCLATTKENGTGTGLTAIYDSRVFTTSTKQFATFATAASIGWTVKLNGSLGQYAPTTSATDLLAGVVAVSNGATATTSINGIIVTGGPAYVESTAGTIGQYINPTTSTGLVNTSATAAGSYVNLGLAQSAFSNTCTANATSDDCRGSLFTIVNIK